jgi:hypothetical protein
VDIGEVSADLNKSLLHTATLGGWYILEHDILEQDILEQDMASRPGDLAERMSSRRDTDSSFSRETFRLPVELARAKAREILNQSPQGDYLTIVDQWRQLSDGRIELTMRRLRAAE